MLKADEINAMRDAATELTQPIIDYLLRDLAQRIVKAGQLTATAQYEVWRLQQLGISQRETKKQLKKMLKVSNRELRKLLTQSAEAGYNYDVRSLPQVQALPFGKNEAVQQIVSAAVALAQDDLSNITQTLGMVDPYGQALPLQDAYRKCMDFAFMQVSTGAADYTTAIQQATKNLADKGVVWIDYESGAHTSLEAAVRRNVMSGMGLMQAEISQRTHDDLGADGWEIDAHNNSAPDHEPIQGRQYSDAAYTALNNSLVRRIGTLNCGHSAHPIIMGVTPQQYSPAELEQMRQKNENGITYNGRHYTGYEATQRQRNLESAMRRQKRKILIDEAAGDAEKLQADQIKLQMMRQEYDRFSSAANLPTQGERAETIGFGWEQARETDRAASAYYKDWAKSIGADKSIKTLADYYDVKYNDRPRYTLLKRYAADVKAGWISPLVRFDGYESLYHRIQTEIVGRETSTGVVITAQSRHFLQRVVGTMSDPGHGGVKRSGVPIESIQDAVFSPLRVDPVRISKSGSRSVKFVGANCAVTINPDTGVLIQTNPRKE